MAYDFARGEVLLLDKPLGWTSFDLVNRVRRLIGGIKVGHAGTLDPLATGLLILCTGAATRTIAQIQDTDKTYLADICLGATTPSYDAEFPPENRCSADYLTPDELEAALGAFRGPILQVPPAFSAVKQQGKRAYALARAGKPVELPPRPVEIFALVVHGSSPTPEGQLRVALEVRCSKGTYIRSLAHDLGQALGVGGYLAGLVRTGIGPHRLADALTLEAFAQSLSVANDSNDSRTG